MNDGFIVTYERPALTSIRRITDHLATVSDCRHQPNPMLVAFDRLEPMLDEIEESLSRNGSSYGVCRALAELGITAYQEMLYGDHRVVYRIHGADALSIYLLAHQREDYMQLLTDYGLIDL